MRKFMVRKTDGVIDPEKRSVFFSNKPEHSRRVVEVEEKTIVEEFNDESELMYQTIENNEAKSLFSESFEAIENFNNEKMKRMYAQLSEEKHLSKELNRKLNDNLTKIANAEAELVKRKNELEAELDEKTSQLIESERFAAIGELSSRLAHDIRTPLTVIRGAVDILRLREGQVMDDYVMKRFDLMEKSIFRITHQIEGVMDYLQKMPLQKREESLKKIIQNSYSSIDIPSNITILPPKEDIMCNCDAIKMEAVFENLIINAIHAIGKENGRIVIRLSHNKKLIMVTVADTGKSIPLEISEKIFEPLFTTKQEGTGLGLSSVKNILELHGGKIELKTYPKRFSIMLPKDEIQNN